MELIDGSAPPITSASDDVLVLSISGRRYAIPRQTANSSDGSLFQMLDGCRFRPGGTAPPTPPPLLLNGVVYRADSDEFFVPRSPLMFDIVLQYLYTGHLYSPPFMCRQALIDELRFWRLINRHSSDCCRPEMPHELNRPASLFRPDQPENNDSTTSRRRRKSSRTNRRRHHLDRLWRFCEEPESSTFAFAFYVVRMLIVLISITNLILSTVPTLRHCDETGMFTSTIHGQPPAEMDNILDNSTESSTEISSEKTKKNLAEKFSRDCEGGLIFDLIEATCIVWFSIELLVRFVAAPGKRAFLKSPLNIIDFFATCPFYVEVIVWACSSLDVLNRVTSVSSLLVMLRVTRVLRAFRVLRVARYFDSLQMIGETLWESRRDLGLLILFLAVGVLLFSTILFYLEKDVPDTEFTSIPSAFWWAIVTLSTTGYGDVTPKTSGGRTAAGMACIAGVLILAFPVSILVEHFRLSYSKNHNGRSKSRLEAYHQAPVNEENVFSERQMRLLDPLVTTNTPPH